MADRTINVAGDFSQSVEITNSLQNGENCVAEHYSHSEGFATSATGEYSYAGGYRSYASNHLSYVWSGDRDNTGDFKSHGEGTYNLYFPIGGTEPIDRLYLNNKTLKTNISDAFDSSYSNSSLKASDNEWSGTNTFKGNITLADGADISATANSKLSFPAGSIVEIGGTATAVTITDETKNNRIATLEYVSNLFQSSLSEISKNYVKWNASASAAIGSTIRPVYVNKNGSVAPVSGDVVFRGTSNAAGSDTQFVYMKGGSITPSTVSAGNLGNRLIYFNNGTLTNSTSSVGGATTLTYLSNGTITASKANVGENSSSCAVPVYLKNGVITSFARNTNIGSNIRPVYLKGGSITECSRDIPSGGGGGGGITRVDVAADIKRPQANLFFTALSSATDGNNAVTITASLARPTIPNIEGLEEKHNEFSKSISELDTTTKSLSTKCSTLETEVGKRAMKFTVGVSGTGNVISSATFSNNAISLQRGVNAITTLNSDVHPTGGTGNVIASIRVGTDKTSITPYMTKAVTSVNESRTSQKNNEFVSYINMTGSQLIVGYGTPSGGGSKAALKVSTVNATSVAKKPSLSITTNQAGVTFIYLVTSLDNSHGLNFSVDGTSSTIRTTGGLLSVQELKAGVKIEISAASSYSDAQTFNLYASTLYTV